MEEKVTIEKTGWWKSFLKSEFFYHYKHNIPAIIGSILVVVAILVAVFGRFIAPQNPYDLTAISLADSYLPPVWLDGGKAGFLLGSDEQGRDILSAIIYGSASSIMIGLVGMICSCAIGTTLGLLAGYFGGKVDLIMMRIVDIIYSLPDMLIIILLSVVFNETLKPLIALTMVGWVTYARTVRGETLSVKKMEYVEAARTIGLPNRIIIIKHVLPNVINSIIVLATIQIGSFILTEATLSFLGVGVPITQPSLGLLVKTGFDVLFSGLWWASVFPGLYIMLIVFGINLLGDFLRDELNPNLK